MSESHVLIPYELFVQLVHSVDEEQRISPHIIVDEEEYSTFVMRNADSMDLAVVEEISQLPTFKLQKEGAP